MTSISIRNNFPEVIRAMEQVGEAAGEKAMVRALNATIAQGKPLMAKQIGAEFRLTAAKIKDRLIIRKASARGGSLRFQAALEATRRGKGRSLNLIAFVSGATRPKPWSGKQLKIQIKRGGGKKNITGAFIGNEGRTVFVRTPGKYSANRVNKKGDSKHAELIRALNTIDVPQMFNTKRINSVVRKILLENFEKNFHRELRAVLRGFV